MDVFHFAVAKSLSMRLNDYIKENPFPEFKLKKKGLSDTSRDLSRHIVPDLTVSLFKANDQIYADRRLVFATFSLTFADASGRASADVCPINLHLYIYTFSKYKKGLFAELSLSSKHEYQVCTLTPAEALVGAPGYDKLPSYSFVVPSKRVPDLKELLSYHQNLSVPDHYLTL